jgi:hypothetical protein
MTELEWRLTEVEENGKSTFTLKIECQAYDEITEDIADTSSSPGGRKFDVIWVTLGLFAASLAPVFLEYT